MLQIFAALFALGLTPGFPAPENPCPRETRAVLDLGSGTTKLIVGEVEKCKDGTRLLKIIDDGESRALALEDSKDATGNIPLDAQERALKVLNELKAVALRRAPKAKVTVVGTHAFRTARNLNSFREKIKAAGFSVRALNQEEEGRAGYQALTATPQTQTCGERHVWAWDIGGGSMQVVNDSRVLGLPMGAEGFKRAMIQKFPRSESTCEFKGETPNPIGIANIASARKTAESKLRQLLKGKVPPNLKDACVFGLGGVHNKAVHKQISTHWDKIKTCVGLPAQESSRYSRKELLCLIEFLSAKNDCDEEIKGPYSTTSVSNLFLVLGWMDVSGIEFVHTTSVGIGQALLLNAP